MKITYDLEYLPERRGGKKSEEILALVAFLADGKKKNMCIEYDVEDEARKKRDALRNYRSTHKLREVFDVYRVENCVYIVKIKKTARRDGA